MPSAPGGDSSGQRDWQAMNSSAGSAGPTVGHPDSPGDYDRPPVRPSSGPGPSAPPGGPTGAYPPATMEHTGSLTGHILSHGPSTAAPRSGNAKVIVILLVVVGLLIASGLAAAVFAQDLVGDLLKGLLGGE